MTRAIVLVIDDEADVRALLRVLFERAGLEVREAENGNAGLVSLLATRPDLVVLDVGMPGLDGWQTLDRIRDLTDVPVLMLTARGAELEKVRALRGGADDYVVKPFGRQELLARVEALLRRVRASVDVAERYADDFLVVEFAQREVSVRGRPVPLTPQEFKLLSTFVRHPDQVLSHDRLLELAWNDPRGVFYDQVRLYVGYLRKKLGPEAPIETVRGFGYRYRSDTGG